MKGIYVVALFLILLMLAFCHESKADVSVEVGATNLSGDWAGEGLIISERFGKYDFGIGYITEQEVTTTCGPHLPRTSKCRFDLRENIFLHAQRVVQYKRCELGIGPAFFQNTNRALGKRFTIGLMAGCRIAERWSIRVRHYSNAGSGTPNLGQDLLSIGYRF